jgi:riboflavin kinase/FMN adenylyltransferase
MRILRGLASFPPDLTPSVAALGSFDGIHLAHARILATTVERARTLGVAAIACTFDPHPGLVLHPERAAAPIATLEENLARIGAQSIDATLIIPFTVDFSHMEAETFVEQVLVKTLVAREVVVGFNHTFGRDARGTAALLVELGRQHGFVTHVLPPLQVQGQPVSSSVIREALREGDVVTARTFLGHAYSVKGPVLRGAGRGRTLGFATANLRPDRPLILAPGVYVARASWPGGSVAAPAESLNSAADAAELAMNRAWAVVNVGYRPTFNEHQYWVEAYLLDFSGDLYDRILTLEFLGHIRAEMKFPSVEVLKAQVMADIDETRRRVAVLGEA